MQVTIGFKSTVKATLGFHSIYHWCYQTIRVFSGAPENPADDIVMEKYCAEAVYSYVNRLMHVIWIPDEVAQQDAMHRMMQIAKS